MLDKNHNLIETVQDVHLQKDWFGNYHFRAGKYFAFMAKNMGILPQKWYPFEYSSSIFGQTWDLIDYITGWYYGISGEDKTQDISTCTNNVEIDNLADMLYY